MRDLSGRLKSHQRDSAGSGSTSYAGGGLQVSMSAEGYQEVTMTSSEGMPVKS